MSNQAKDWQEGSYTVCVRGNFVEASKVYKERVGSLTRYKKSSAIAKCDPEDEFSLSMGVALAMDRLSKELGKGKIEVGDKVRIKYPDLSYITYVSWIAENVNDVKLAACYAYDSTPRADEITYVVKAIALGGTNENDPTLAFVQRYFVFNGKIDTNQPCYLIGIDGLEKIYG